MAIIHKFGRSIVGTTYTPVCMSGFYRTPIAATALEVVSDHANDTSAGTGAQEVMIYGLDSSWNEVIQTVELNGITAVNLSTDLIRLYRWFVNRSGAYATQSAGSHAGKLTIQEQVGGAVWSEIDATDFPLGQSQIAAYTVPVGRVCQIPFFSAHVDSTKTADIILMKRSNADDVVTPFTGAMRIQIELNGVANDTLLSPPEPLGPYGEMTDIIAMAKVSATTGAVSVDFQIDQERT